jgi:hypothetical protein
MVSDQVAAEADRRLVRPGVLLAGVRMPVEHARGDDMPGRTYASLAKRHALMLTCMAS